jgi:hypothetical protein
MFRGVLATAIRHLSDAVSTPVGFTRIGPKVDHRAIETTTTKRRRIMFEYTTGSIGPEETSSRFLGVPARLTAALLATGLALAAFATEAWAEEIPLDDASLIIETNASDCDVGIQVKFDGESWQKMKITGPDGRLVFDIRLKGNWAFWGLTEHFNESQEPVMAELASLDPDCDEEESSLEEFQELFPEGEYEFEGRTTEGDELDGEAFFSHVIPAAPIILQPMDVPQDPDNTVIEWAPVTDPIATDPPVPGLGPVDIDHYLVLVEDEESSLLYTAEVPADVTEISVPPEFLDFDAEYKFEVLAIDATGNQTITEDSFETMEAP